MCGSGILPGQAEELPLSHTEVVPRLGHASMQPSVELPHCTLELHGLQRLPQPHIRMQIPGVEVAPGGGARKGTSRDKSLVSIVSPSLFEGRREATPLPFSLQIYCTAAKKHRTHILSPTSQKLPLQRSSPDGATEEHGVLGDDGQLAAQPVQTDAGHVHAVKKDAPRVHGDEAEEGQHQGGLARACVGKRPDRQSGEKM